MIPDLVNGLFEFFGSLFILNHTKALWQSRQARGISLVSVIYFAGWGIWNLFYYPHLDQWFSFAGGCAIMAANFFWIGSIAYLRLKK
jgi:hypothetical protein